MIRRCTCCDRVLNEAKIVWLEYDRRDLTYHNFGDVPEADSQGAFEFGPGCARKKIAEAKRGSPEQGRMDGRHRRQSAWAI